MVTPGPSRLVERRATAENEGLREEYMELQLVLIGGTEVEAQLRSLEDYAKQPEHWRQTNSSEWPGPEYCREIKVEDLLSGESVRFRIIFTYTIGVVVNEKGEEQDMPPMVGRHATILSERGLPSPIAVYTICHFLGFTGLLSEWQVMRHPGVETAIVAVQAVSPVQPADQPSQVN